MINSIKKFIKKRKQQMQCAHIYRRRLVDTGRNFFWVCEKCNKWVNGNADVSKLNIKA